MPGIKTATKGLCEEQRLHPIADGPWIDATYDGLPYLSVATGDPFFYKWYKMLVQTQIGLQLVDEKYPFFALGLTTSYEREGPKEHFADTDPYEHFGLHPIKGNTDPMAGYEDSWGMGKPHFEMALRSNFDGRKCVWITFNPMCFISDMTSPNSYRYVGGSDWGVGLDYELAFEPSARPDEPYVICSSTRLVSVFWDDQKCQLHATLRGKVGEKGILKVKVFPSGFAMPKTQVFFNNEIQTNPSLNYEKATEECMINYNHNQPLLNIMIGFKKN